MEEKTKRILDMIVNINQRLDSLENKMDKQFDQLETRLENFEQKLISLQK